MRSCNSIEKRFNVEIPEETLTIFPSDYPNCGLGNPEIFPVTDRRTHPTFDEIYHDIVIGDVNSFNKISFRVSVIRRKASIQNKPPGVIISVDNIFPDQREISVTVKLVAGNSLFRGTYVLNDAYKIVLEEELFGNDVLQVQFTRQIGVIESGLSASLTSVATTQQTNLIGTTALQENLISETCVHDICNQILIPQVNIVANPTIDASDVGDAIFTVIDEFNYNNHNHSIPENTCAIRYTDSNNVKETVFRRCCPYLVSVIKGKGKTFYDRASSMYNKIGEVRIGVGFVDFYRNLVLYGLSKYILSRLLYGDFNIDYLLGKYNEQFLSDLGSSRFCRFIEFFEDCESPVRGYNRYFKYE